MGIRPAACVGPPSIDGRNGLIPRRRLDDERGFPEISIFREARPHPGNILIASIGLDDLNKCDHQASRKDQISGLMHLEIPRKTRTTGRPPRSAPG
jgi:hypothetical protein